MNSFGEFIPVNSVLMPVYGPRRTDLEEGYQLELQRIDFRVFLMIINREV